MNLCKQRNAWLALVWRKYLIPAHQIHLLDKLLGRDRRPALGEELYLPSDITLRRLAGKNVVLILPLLGDRRFTN
jgi:hypothetical protein